jgi:chorismate synthase
MSGDSLGEMFRVTSFGESHGKCVGVVVEGCPAGLKISEQMVQEELDRRRAVQTIYSTPRMEEDKVEIVSGVFNGFTTGAPICMIVWNREFDSKPYDSIRFTPRPGHADYTAYMKYGGFNDYRGGGRFSGRITIGFVMAGAVAKKILSILDIEVIAYTVEIAGIRAKVKDILEVKENVRKSVVGCPDLKASNMMVEAISSAKEDGDSVGGVIECVALNVPVGLGEPVFKTLEGELARAFYAIPGVKGVEFGAGFDVAKMRGSENNDQYILKGGRVVTRTNNCGGVLGGISNGMPIVCRVAVKPPSSISREQDTVDLARMEETKLKVVGRHDACIVPRALPVVESMMAIVLVDNAIKAGIIPRVLRG